MFSFLSSVGLLSYQLLGPIQVSASKVVLFIICVMGLVSMAMLIGGAYRLQLKLSELEEKTHDWDQLLRILLHDINGPMISIDAAAKSVSEESSEKQKLALKLITASTVEALGLIEKIRRVKMYQDSKARQNSTLLFVDDVVEQSLDDVQSAATEKKISLEHSSECEELILCDALILRHIVIWNILTNAIKYSHSNSRIEVKTLSREGKVILSIRDYGQGMSQEKCLNLLSSNHWSKTGGYGVPVVKDYLEKIGGHLAIRSSDIDRPEFRAGTEITLEFKIHQKSQ